MPPNRLMFSSLVFSASLSKWPHGADRILRVLVALFAFSKIASAQDLIDYHQHLLMPTEESPQGFLASDLVKLLDETHISRALVLSMAYRYGNPNQPSVADEYAHV